MPSKELRPYKEISKDLSVDETTAALDMTTTILRNLGGRPFKYANTEEGLQDFIENSLGYFTYLQSANSKLDEKQQIIPDIEGYCLWLGICRSTLKTYHDRGGEWQRVIDLHKEGIASVKKQLMLKGRIPSVMGIFDLTNNHSYYNTNSFVIENKTTADKEDNTNDLEERIMEAGLVWDNDLKEFVPKED